VHTEARRAQLESLAGAGASEDLFVCDVEREDEIARLAAALGERGVVLDGFVHSIAFADYRGGARPFAATSKADFLRAVDVSCYSLIALARALAPLSARGASFVTISISDTRMAAENYGLMGPVKAALDSAVAFLAKSYAPAGIRFNAVKAGPLKTASSAGIPGYLESYLYAEQATLRGRALATEEVAEVALFLLDPRSSGVNAQGLVVDAGMSVNYFDRELVRRATRVEEAR
jgi:enoyl-[acyl-carrier protein] reductase I